MSTSLSVVLPCYNESKNIRPLLQAYATVAEEISLELILVENGSSDDSRAVIARELKQPEFSFARCVPVDKNEGYGPGIRAGLRTAGSPVVGFSDADLQCPPGDVLTAYRTYKRLSSTAPLLVKGRRTNRAGLEALISGVYNALACALLLLPRVDINGQPKLFDRSLIPALENGPDDFAFNLFVLRQASRAGAVIAEFDVRFKPRVHGQSTWAHGPAAKMLGILRAFRQLALIRLNRYP